MPCSGAAEASVRISIPVYRVLSGPYTPESRPPPGGVDRNRVERTLTMPSQCRPPPGGVDRNRHLCATLGQRERSPPTRGRGSKHGQNIRSMISVRVAPHPGAWIETDPPRKYRPGPRSPPTRGRGSKPLQSILVSPRSMVAPHPGAWIETAPLTICPPRLSRPPPGGVDRNAARRGHCGGVDQVAPHPGAWIETITSTPMRSGSQVAPHPGAWIETP